MMRHASLAFSAELTARWAGLGRASRTLAIAPFFHITGFVCHLLTALSARATLIAYYRFDPALVLDVIRRSRPTFTVGAITAFNALMSAPGAAAEDFASFERICSGGAPIPPALAADFEARLGRRLYPAYGMTEVSGATHFAPFGRPAPIDPGSGTLSIGIPGSSIEAIIADENDNELPVGEVGELLVRSPQLMMGYWRKPEESAAALRNGWMHTGDVGLRDAAGWFYLVDRKKDMIIASGFKVWPREVEDVLYMHPVVREAAVIGVADAYRGETVKAYISLKAGARYDEGDLLGHCREHLAAYKIPKMIEVLPELPKSMAGKIQRVVLKEQNRAQSAALPSARAEAQ
jgi:long-chain acyl-CoA synthetase